eukprot:200310-Chlamydomonas_euryale.AAC.2
MSECPHVSTCHIIKARAPFHTAFAPFVLCVGPAHSNIHLDQGGLSRTLQADAIPQHSGVTEDSFGATPEFKRVPQNSRAS